MNIHEAGIAALSEHSFGIPLSTDMDDYQFHAIFGVAFFIITQHVSGVTIGELYKKVGDLDDLFIYVGAAVVLKKTPSQYDED